MIRDSSVCLQGLRKRTRARRASAIRARSEGGGEVQDQDHQAQRDCHDPERDQRPPRPADRRLAARLRARLVGSRGVGGRVSHSSVLSAGVVARVSGRQQSYRDTMSLSRQNVFGIDALYARVVPKLWTETIEAHRAAVRDATLDTAAALAADNGLASLTMSQIAEQAGIGRATLYKYFPDVESILVAWHERQITRHLQQLLQVRDQADGPGARLEPVLGPYPPLPHDHPDTHLPPLLP